MMQVPSDLVNQFLNTNLLVVGEVHGVAENASLYSSLIRELEISSVALEWPTQLAHVFDAFFETGWLDMDVLSGFLGDGRINREYLELFRYLYQHKSITSYNYFDNYDNYPGETSWNKRAQSYTDYFLQHYESTQPTLLIAGNLHTRMEKFSMDSEQGELVPMGYLLRKSLGNFPMCSIKYNGGEYYNFGIQKFADTASVKSGFRKVDDYYEYTMLGASAAEVLDTDVHQGVGGD